MTVWYIPVFQPKQVILISTYNKESMPEVNCINFSDVVKLKYGTWLRTYNISHK